MAQLNPVPIHHLARLIGSDDRVALIVRLPHCALIRDAETARWVPSGWLALTAAECAARKQRLIVAALRRGRL